MCLSPWPHPRWRYHQVLWKLQKKSTLPPQKCAMCATLQSEVATVPKQLKGPALPAPAFPAPAFPPVSMEPFLRAGDLPKLVSKETKDCEKTSQPFSRSRDRRLSSDRGLPLTTGPSPQPWDVIYSSWTLMAFCQFPGQFSAPNNVKPGGYLTGVPDRMSNSPREYSDSTLFCRLPVKVELPEGGRPWLRVGVTTSLSRTKT